MHFVNENDSPASAAAGTFSFSHHFLDFFDARKHRAEGNEFRSCHTSDNPSNRSFSTAGRPPQNHRADIVALDLCSKRRTGPEHRFLANTFIQCARPHPVRERTSRLWTVFVQPATRPAAIFVRRIKYGEKAHSNSAGRREVGLAEVSLFVE